MELPALRGCCHRPGPATLLRMTTTPTTASRIPFPDLAARIEGALILPADDEFVHAAQAWNLAVPQHPCAVLHARTAADVVHAVRFAIDHSLPVSAQPGGHGATTATDGSLLIRTAALDDIWIDADARVARVGAGVKWGQLQSALDGTGLTGLVGSSPDVTVVGFCLSGGLSWFGRAHGTGAATIRAVELVDATGAHRWVDDSTDASLMWALRGGGGEFGIVTAMEIALVPAPELTGGRLLFPVEDAPRVWRAFAEVTTVAPRELTLFASVLHFPPIPELPEEIRGRSFCAVDAVLLGGRRDPCDAAAPDRRCRNAAAQHDRRAAAERDRRRVRGAGRSDTGGDRVRIAGLAGRRHTHRAADPRVRSRLRAGAGSDPASGWRVP
ncbi:FAD-binding oxidoreductase [Rhodococcus zopfii]|uniref:FAD-binding oxidoreductase n=1 Tax=Rhodococcus zopfii TaxID=43772 RepID=A0ABU3WQR8_9NOCA|nr:FAD-binding oxidoreductase [Rhodococcus zopfii]